MSNAQQLAAWRNFRTNWAKYYADVGTLVYSNPSDPQIAAGKQYTNQLTKWISVLKSYKDCIGPAAGLSHLTSVDPAPSPQTPKDSDFFDTKTLLTIGGSLAAAVLLRQLLK
jgi:hypothetical protein